MSAKHWLLDAKRSETHEGPRPKRIRKALAGQSGEHSLSPEQAAICKLLCGPQKVNYVVVGPPGQGKTVLMRSVIAELTKSNLVIVLAPTNVALSQYNKSPPGPAAKLLMSTTAAFVCRGINSPATPMSADTVKKQRRKITEAMISAKTAGLVAIFDEFGATAMHDHDNCLRILNGVVASKKVIMCGDPQQLPPVKAKHPFLGHFFWRADGRRVFSEVIELARTKLQLLSLTGKNHRFKHGDAEHTAELSQLERQIRRGNVCDAARTLNSLALSRSRAPPPGTKDCIWITATRERRRHLSLRALKRHERLGHAVLHVEHPSDKLQDVALIKNSPHRLLRMVPNAQPHKLVGQCRRLDNGTVGKITGWVNTAEEKYAIFRPDGMRKEFRVPLLSLNTTAAMTITASQGMTCDGVAVLDCLNITTVFRTSGTLLQALCVACTRSKNFRVQNFDLDEMLKLADSTTKESADAEIVAGMHDVVRRLISGKTIRTISRTVKVSSMTQKAVQTKLWKKHADNPSAVLIVKWDDTTGVATLANGLSVVARIE